MSEDQALGRGRAAPDQSPTVDRLALELTDRQAAALGSAISDTTAIPPDVAQLQGVALAGVFQIVISEAGRLAREGQSQTTVADELYPIVENILDELGRWLSVSGPPAPAVPEPGFARYRTAVRSTDAKR